MTKRDFHKTLFYAMFGLCLKRNKKGTNNDRWQYKTETYKDLVTSFQVQKILEKLVILILM